MVVEGRPCHYRTKDGDLVVVVAAAVASYFLVDFAVELLFASHFDCDAEFVVSACCWGAGVFAA